MILKEKIKKEILRLSDDHNEETINLINNILRPMLAYIEEHERIMVKMVRISGKHIT